MFKRLIMLTVVSALYSLNVTFQDKPSTYQLYPRDAANNGTIRIRGVLNETGYDSFSVAVTRNNRPWARTAVPAVYSGPAAAFDRICDEVWSSHTCEIEFF